MDSDFSDSPARQHPVQRDPFWKIFLIFLRLGVSAFGGPVAHLGYFREEFVTRRAWLSDSSYADLVALCQFLPGPASSQVGMALGLTRGGYAGALAAWAGFTLPSAGLLILFALGLSQHLTTVPEGLLHGLMLAAVAVVAQAVWSMTRSLCADWPRRLLAVAAACIALAVPFAMAQLAVIAVAAALGVWLFRPPAHADVAHLSVPVSARAGIAWLSLLAVLLAGLPVTAAVTHAHGLAEFDAFFRSGALVFGGGHVVLPLLREATVATGWVTQDVFMAGYGAVQAMPGPLFAFAAFLGASMQATPNGWSGGVLCLCAIFLPSFLLVAGTLPFWAQLRANRSARAALGAVNAAVVGLLAAALCQLVVRNGIRQPLDAVIAGAALLALMRWKVPPWLLVVACAVAGCLLSGAR